MTKSNLHKVATTVRWYCDTDSCLCRASKWTESLNHGTCAKNRSNLEKKKCVQFICTVLGQLFEIGKDGSDGDVVRSGDDEADIAQRRNWTLTRRNSMVHRDSLSDSSDEEDIDSASSDGENSTWECAGEGSRSTMSEVKDEWIRFKLHDSFHCTEVMEGLLENIQFFLGEPITLGLFPFFTHGKYDDIRPDEEMADKIESEIDEGEAPECTVVLNEWGMKYMDLLSAHCRDAKKWLENNEEGPKDV